MYGLPSDFDASVFVGAELVLVSYTANTIHLVFEPDLEVTIESSHIVRIDSNATETVARPPVVTSCLMALVGKKVQTAVGTSDGTLVLTFENGGSVSCIDDSKEYESYRIRSNGKEFVI
jgi:hypothetical protein